MFRPSPPILLSAGSLDGSFALRYVTASSSASTFTATTASSADPLPITAASLHRLGSRCRSYSDPGTGGLSPGKTDNSVIAHPPPLPGRVTERISGFGSRGYLALPPGPPRGSHQAWVAILATASFRSLIGSHVTGLSLFGQPMGVSSGTLAFAYTLPPFRSVTGLSPVSYRPCRSHLPSRKLKHEIFREAVNISLDRLHQHFWFYIIEIRQM